MFRRSSLKLSTENQSTLLVELNRIVEESAERSAQGITQQTIASEIACPPNGELNEDEQSMISNLESNDVMHSAMRKILSDCAASAIFHFLNLIDGTGDPEVGSWKGDGITLVDLTDNVESSSQMLHDDFLEQYWSWKKTRKKDWSLDNPIE